MSKYKIIAGLPVYVWSTRWRPLSGGLRQPHPELRLKVGLFRMLLGATPVYLGCATEFANGGLSKRLGDFTRPGHGARNHHAGVLIHEHRDQVEIELIVTGNDHAAATTAKRLKEAFLALDRPPWNVPVRRR
ncbi:MAG: hypothetical protein ACK4Z8_02435 [Novosphingobium sp.]